MVCLCAVYSNHRGLSLTYFQLFSMPHLVTDVVQLCHPRKGAMKFSALSYRGKIPRFFALGYVNKVGNMRESCHLNVKIGHDQFQTQKGTDVPDAIAFLILVASAMSGHVPLWRDGGRFIPTSQYGLGKASMHGHQSLHVLLLTAVCALAGECLVGRDPEWRKDLQDHFTCQDRQEIQELACRFRTIRYDPISQDCEGKAAKEALFLPRVSKNWKVGRSWLDTRTSLVHVWGNMLGKCASASLGKFRCSSLAEGQIFRVCAPKTSGFKISYWSLIFFINGDAKACKKLICTLEIYLLSNPIQIKFWFDLIWIKSWLHPI